MKVFIWSSLLSGIRSHSFQLLVVLSLLIIGLAWLAANFSARHPETLALDVGLSGMRAILIFMALFWVQDLIGRDIERKTVMFALSYPVPRSHYLLGRFFGIALLSAGSVAIMAAILWLTLQFKMVDYQQLTPIDTGMAYWATCALFIYQYFGGGGVCPAGRNPVDHAHAATAVGHWFCRGRQFYRRYPGLFALLRPCRRGPA